MVRRRSLGNFDLDTASSARRSEANTDTHTLLTEISPRRRSAGNVSTAKPMPERFRAPVRSLSIGNTQDAAKHMNECLLNHPLFKNANKLFVDQITQGMTVELFQPGATILEEGEIAYLLYFLHRGEVQVTVKGKEVATLTDGAFFGEMALLEKNSKRSATVTASRFCDCRVIHKSHFGRLLKLFPAERAFFEAEAERRAAQLASVKKQENEKLQLASNSDLKQPRRKQSGQSDTKSQVQALPDPYIAEAFLVTAMMNRARGAHQGGALDDDPSASMGGMSITC